MFGSELCGNNLGKVLEVVFKWNRVFVISASSGLNEHFYLVNHIGLSVVFHQLATLTPFLYIGIGVLDWLFDTYVARGSGK